MNYEPGDFVTRISYNSDIIFKIERIEGDRVILRSCKMRLLADAPPDDLKPYNGSKMELKKNILMESYEYLMRQQRNLVLNRRIMKQRDINENSFRERQAKILHLDGDRNFLELSLQNYKNLQLDVSGFFIREKGQPEIVIEYLKKYNPDILVITGHDGKYNESTYRTSQYFIQVVKLARSYLPDLDQLVIFAGACQSNYHDLLTAGANFASSPGNKLIHFLDPILVIEKIAFTSIKEIISAKEIIQTTISGEGGIGGVETRGKLRLCYP